MRLINADKLTADYIVASTTTNTQCYRYISKEQVENALTVEAIPIELIYKIRNLYLENDCIISAGVCNEILNMWGKENEIS